MTPEMHLLGHVNNMRKCCDMSLFHRNLQEQGFDFIADSLKHANDIFAKYAYVSHLSLPSQFRRQVFLAEDKH